MEELPKLYASRIDYIKPCVNTLISSQAKFYQEYSQFYESILKDSSSASSEPDNETTSASAAVNSNNGDENRRDYVNMPPSTTKTASSSSSAASAAAANDQCSTSADDEIEKLSDEIQQCLKEIKSLSIVASD